MRTPTLRECHQFIKIVDVRTHPRTEPNIAATATGRLERRANHYGMTVEALLAYARAEALRAEMAKASSSVFGTTPPRAARREWRDKVNPPPYDWFETSAAHDGPPRQGVTAITIVTALLVPRTYVWNGTGFTKPGSKTRRWNLIRSVPINGLDDLLSHLKTLTPFEHVVMGKPAQDTPQLAKQKLSAKVHGDLRTILDTPRPYVICDCDSLPNLGDVDVTKLSPAKIHSFAVASLPEEFRTADCLMFYSNSHGTAPGKVKVHLYFWLSRAIGKTLRELWLKAINALAGLSGDEDDRAVDPRLALPGQALFAAAPKFRRAPDPVPQRWHHIKGTTRTVEVPKQADLEKILAGRRPRFEGGPGSGGAGGSTGGWVGILENMGDATGTGFHDPQKMAIGLYVRLFGADCDPEPFYKIFDALIDERAVPDRGSYSLNAGQLLDGHDATRWSKA